MSWETQESLASLRRRLASDQAQTLVALGIAEGVSLQEACERVWADYVSDPTRHRYYAARYDALAGMRDALLALDAGDPYSALMSLSTAARAAAEVGWHESRQRMAASR